MWIHARKFLESGLLEGCRQLEEIRSEVFCPASISGDANLTSGDSVPSFFSRADTACKRSTKSKRAFPKGTPACLKDSFGSL
jgi:hypothetical protein